MQTIKNLVAKIRTGNFGDFRSVPGLWQTWAQRIDSEPAFYAAWLNRDGFTLRLGKVEAVVSFPILVGPARLAA